MTDKELQLRERELDLKELELAVREKESNALITKSFIDYLSKNDEYIFLSNDKIAEDESVFCYLKNKILIPLLEC